MSAGPSSVVLTGPWSVVRGPLLSSAEPMPPATADNGPRTTDNGRTQDDGPGWIPPRPRSGKPDPKRHRKHCAGHIDCPQCRARTCAGLTELTPAGEVLAVVCLRCRRVWHTPAVLSSGG